MNLPKPEECELVKHCDENFKPWLDRYKYPSKYNDNALRNLFWKMLYEFSRVIREKTRKKYFFVWE